MAFRNQSLVEETTTSSGTSQSITLNGKATGRRSFADAGYSAGDTCNYVLIQGNNFEAGTGTFQGGSDFDRASTPEFSTNGGNRIDLDGSEANVIVSPLAERALIEDGTGRWVDGDGTQTSILFNGGTKSSNFTADPATEYQADVSTSALTMTLPGSPQDGDHVGITDASSNASTNNITVDGNGNNIIGASNFTINRDNGYAFFIYDSDSGEWKLSANSQVITSGVVAFDEFTSSGTWNKAAGASYIYIEAIGGGGGGRNSTSGFSAGAGGGGGFTSAIYRASQVGSSETVTIGSGGSGGADGGNNNGSDGGDSTFGSLVTGRGGKGGSEDSGGNGGGGEVGGIYQGTNSSDVRAPSSGGFSSGGGDHSRTQGSSDAVKGGAGGGGGTSVEGGNGGAHNFSNNTAAGDGSAPGGGGGASYNDGGGGAGASGRIRVWQW